MLRRRGVPKEETEPVEAAADSDRPDADPPAAAAGPGPKDVAAADRGVERIDLGPLRLPALDQMGVDLQVDPNGTVVAVTVLLGASAVQLAVFAAARSEGLWDQVRKELRGNIGSSGGLVDETVGDFGPELRANLPAVTPDGKSMMTPTRFLGFDGPRWFLRVTLQGAACTPAGDPRVAELLSGVVVDRGSEAMAPGDALPLRLPGQVHQPTDLPGRPTLTMFERGPEITEIR